MAIKIIIQKKNIKNVAEKKIGEEGIIKLIDEFIKSNLEIDKKIGGEIDSLFSSENIP